MIALICARTGLHGTADITGSRNSNRFNDFRKKLVGREDHLGRATARCAVWGPIVTRAVHHVIRPQGDEVSEGNAHISRSTREPLANRGSGPTTTKPPPNPEAISWLSPCHYVSYISFHFVNRPGHALL
jgi:hypothetical protein